MTFFGGAAVVLAGAAVVALAGAAVVALAGAAVVALAGVVMIRRPPGSTHCIAAAASDVYKGQEHDARDARVER